MIPELFHVPTLSEDEWDEFTARLAAFEESDEMRDELQKHIDAIENDRFTDE